MRATLLLLIGCSGPAGLDTDAGVDLDASCAFESVVRARVFEPSCTNSRCHDSSRPRADLDLEQPGITERILNRASIHDECAERLLVVPGIARASFLMDKVLGVQGECGESMPPDDTLSLDQRRCLVEWIDSMPVD